MILQRLHSFLAQLYDAPVEHDLHQYLITDRRELSAFVGAAAAQMTDEQVLMTQDEEGVRLALFIEQPVLDRLERGDPLLSLDDHNLPDYCTALEGVSHFHYLMWNLTRGRDVSLLELELQAEVDKYASAVTLLTRQLGGRLPERLHARLFDRVRFAPGLDAAQLHRYEQANRHAARFCRALERRYLRARRTQPERWLAELRRFFRSSHHEKLRVAAL